VIYLYGYLGIGALVMFCLLLKNRFKSRKEDKSSSDSRGMSCSLSDVMILASGVPIWPFWVYLQVSQGGSGHGTNANQEFVVTREDLLSEMSISEIEQREKVSDPLGAVPDLPFGHLNAAWKEFLEKARPTDNLWTFSARWRSRFGSVELRQGYVVVREEEIGPYFLALRKYLGKRGFPTKRDKLRDDIPAFLRKHAD
jgi:hypothetical protein